MTGTLMTGMAATNSTDNSPDSTTIGNASNETKPNVLFISVDDLNDWVGVLGGYPGVQTPNIDRLARSGTLFTRAYSPVPVCNGARTSVLTGLQPDTTGVYLNSQDWRAIIPDAVTIPEHFKQNEYEVVGVGKLFHRIYNKPEAFNQYFESPGNIRPAEPPDPRLPEAIVTNGPADPRQQKVVGDALTAQTAVDYINQEHNQPFFLSVGIAHPHTPWVVPQEYFDLYPIENITLPKGFKQNDLSDIPPLGKELADGRTQKKVIASGEWKELIQSYLASVTFADAMIGRVLDALYKSPSADNTIVVLWSDHGFHLGEKDHWHKTALWEEATRIPMVIAAPGVTEAGQVAEQPVSAIDLYPTLIDLAGLPHKGELEGASLVPLLQNPNATWDRPAISSWEHKNGEHSYAIRTERWRYIRYYDGTGELYDHQTDPYEFTNLANKPGYAGIKAELADQLADQLAGGGKQLAGTLKNDTLNGGDGPDVLLGKGGDDVLSGNKGDDGLWGGSGDDSLYGGSGKDFLRGGSSNDRLNGGPGDDILVEAELSVIRRGNGTDTIIGFSGVGAEATLSSSVTKQVDVLKFIGAGLTAKNMLLTQQGSDLLVEFAGVENTKAILKDFELEDLDNGQGSTGTSVGLGNVLFDGQKTVEDSIDVFNANQQRQQIFNRNSVTFLNNLDNNIQGFNRSDDVINAQGGNDSILGLWGNDLLRGGSGRDQLTGGQGNDILVGDIGVDRLQGGPGNDLLNGGSDNDLFVLTAYADTTDTVQDFKNGSDRFGLAGGLTFRQLTISQSNSNTLIRATKGGEVLASLTGVNANLIGAEDFTVV